MDAAAADRCRGSAMKIAFPAGGNRLFDRLPRWGGVVMKVERVVSARSLIFCTAAVSSGL